MNGSKQKCAVLTLTCMLILISGCGDEESSGPELTTYAVRGMVYQANGRPLSQGMIEFQPLEDGKANGRGTIQDGKFTLTMRLNGKNFTGVPAGEYRVTVMPRESTQDQQRNPEYIVLPKPVTIKANSKNELKLTLPKK